MDGIGFPEINSADRRRRVFLRKLRFPEINDDFAGRLPLRMRCPIDELITILSDFSAQTRSL